VLDRLKFIKVELPKLYGVSGLERRNILMDPKELSFDGVFRDPEGSCDSPHGHTLAKELKDDSVELRLFLVIGGAEASRGEGFTAGLALKSSDFLVVSEDTEEAFFYENSSWKCVVEA